MVSAAHGQFLSEFLSESLHASHPQNGSVKDQLISSGPYTCEHISHIRHFAAATLASCATACNSNSNCSFYQLGVASETCTLFRRCDYLQQIDLQLVNKLYGVAPKGDFCRIADPDQCWTKIKRRSYLSLSPSSVPRCLFQAQYDACDALQQISGEQAGQCQRCQYLESNSSYAAKGISKVPLPEDFPSGSQVSIGCNYTGRLFSRLENGLTWDGPRPSAVFTCVSGKWVGEPGAWQHLENLTCLQCIQLGTPSLWRLTEITLPEVYFLEHRQIQVTHATTAGPGCSTASKQTASPLKVQVQAEVWVDVCISKTEIALSACGDIPSFYQDLQLRLHVTGASDECLKYQQGKLAMCNCLDPGALRLERQRLRLGSKCVFASDIQKDPAAFQMVDCDALGPRQLWHLSYHRSHRACFRVGLGLIFVSFSFRSFSSGNCIFGMDMVDTADRAWNFSVAVQGDDSELQLVQMKFAPERQSEPVLPAYSLGQSNAFLSTCLTMQDGKLVIAEAPCKGGFVVEEFQSGTTIAYYPDPKLQEDPYYLYDNDGTVCSLGTSCASPSSGSTRSVPDMGLFVSTSEVGLLPTTATLPSTAFWNIQPDNGGTVKLKNVHTSKCAASTGQALKVNDARWAPVSNNFQYDCKRSFVTGLSSKKDAGNYKLCGDWDDAKGTFKGMSLRGENCHNFSRTLTESESKVTINCPQGTYLIDDPGNNDNSLPNHGHDFKKGEQLWWECCDMSLPPYVWFDNQHTYELKATLTDDDRSWNYSCALGNDKDDDDGLNKYTGSFMTSFTWTSHEPDSSVGCVSGLHSLSPSGDVSLQACDDASRSSAFVDWAMDPLTPKSSTEASPASPALPEELSSCQACQASLFVDLNESIFHKTGGISEATDLSLTVESLPELSVQQRQGYQYVHQLFVLEKTGKKEEASVSPSDLQGAYATGSNLTVEKVCPLLMSMSSMEKLPRSVEPVSGLKGLTMKSFSDIMMDQAYTSIAFGSPQKWPFLFNGAGDERADAVGFLSVPKNGDPGTKD
ncbi:hypothetical protein AK812_SmicGene38103 [Symbiodinium microadriaticum]|uniref:Uncharacterized protein n=1 Tax=Symbiodinium microadriaticum TaxID=2951 RepID=A0A1Q9CEK8_SYMMI|nr:hypothetical protein AK812_SmicGene38103 [Symbiodinium microadriaticum]